MGEDKDERDILLTQKIARQPLQLLLPQHLATIFLGVSLWMIIVGS